MKKIVLFFCMTLLPAHVLAGVGYSDNRKYITDQEWSTEPYNKFVLLEIGVYHTEHYSYPEFQDYAYEYKEFEIEWDDELFVPISTCSAQYISPNLILSAGHCIMAVDELNSFMEDKLRFKNLKNKRIGYRIGGIKDGLPYRIPVELVYTEYTDTVFDALGDWAVWMVERPEFYSNSYFDVKTPTKTIDVINAGFGWVRILSAEELTTVREIFNELSSENEQISINDARGDINAKLQEVGITTLSDIPNRLKASTCKIVFDDCRDIGERAGDLETMITLADVDPLNENPEFDGLYSKTAFLRGVNNFIQDKFKNICNNQSRLRKVKKYPYILATTCDSWGGNSGGGYISNDGKYIYGTCSYGMDGFDDQYNTDYMVSAKQFETKIQELIKKYDHNNPPKENIAKIPTNLYGNKATKKGCKAIGKKLKNGECIDVAAKPLSSSIFNQDILEQKINKALPNIKMMTSSQFLKFLDDWVEYDVNQQRIQQLQKAYEAAKARETSYANRMLGGVTMAATGIGGMELAQGLAEQKADEAADRDMQAYMATFQCRIGDKGGKTYTGGTKGIEVPGANQLIDLYQEYVNLAADLKQRKESLGMRPGIESEVVLNKANMGLYSDEAIIEKRNGTYASIYRAATGNETDAEKLQEQRDTSAKRADVGGKVGVGGAAGGLVGNVLLNHVNGGKWGAGASGTKSDSNILEKGADVVTKIQGR